MKKLMLVILCLMPLIGQEAKIIILERKDTVIVKNAYEDYKAAKAKWEVVKNGVANKYVMEDGKILSGWESVEFSVDFRAVVPKYRTSFGYCNVLTTNAIGTATGTATTFTNNTVSSDLTVDVKENK